ncbi:MAG: PHP domain-containing protein [Gammaproteobacteria bacterium]|nr:PHP domain-containing protein [Gammaproteobacteria bacterium]NNJ72913.1 PHP domain-containing protein [Enterobacterales bacterium]
MIVDLHCHSNFSDGELSPEALLERARLAEITLFSITDHDTLAAYRQLDLPLAGDMRLLSGVEISCNLETSELHVIGLNVDIDNQALNNLLDYNQTLRKDKAAWVIARLIHLGYSDIQPFLDELATGPIVCRTHLAQALVKAGIVPDYERAFKQFLGRSGKVWKRPQWRDCATVIQTIQNAGGIAILAHPTKYRFSSGKMSWVIEQFAALGGDAMEVNYSGLSPNHKAYLKRMALKYELAASVGSDFHRPAQRYAPLGGFHQIDSSLPTVWQQLAL